jgi:uncharacterized membrane protein
MPLFLKQTLGRLKSIPRKYIFEVLAVIGALFLLAFVVSSISPYNEPKQYAFAESSNSATLYRATVLSNSPNALVVELKDGPNEGSEVTVSLENITDLRGLHNGADVVVSDSTKVNGLVYLDIYRVPILIFIIALFVVTVLLVGRRKGMMSLAGLGAGIVVIGWIIIPLIVNGYNSLYVSVLGAYLIAVVSILIAHGFERKTYISLACVLIVLILVTAGSVLVVNVLGLSGIIDEPSYFLQLDHPTLDLSGILVGGIVIAALGALDDVVTTQVATVQELKKTDVLLSKNELYKKAILVGSEHIAALVNTLALVYVGAALPLIVTYAFNTPNLLMLFNSEFIATEIARTIIVSIGLVVSVPISTYVAAHIIANHKINT